MSTTKTVHVRQEDIPLSDHKAVASVLKSMDIVMDDVSEGTEPGWLLELRRIQLDQQWHQKDRKEAGQEVWSKLDERAGVLRQIVIIGLRDEREAELFRSECWRARNERHLPLDVSSIEALAADFVSNRSVRDHQKTFESALEYVRDCFTRQDGQVVEGKGRLLPISKLGLTKDDVDVLHAVYERLPPTVFDRPDFSLRAREDTVQVKEERCPTCGARPVRREPVKTRSDALRKLNEFHAHHTQDVFKVWVKARVVADAAAFTSSADLHKDYWQWAAKYGDNRQQKRTSKDTRLTLNVWGRLMRGESFMPVKRARAKGYRVRLRRQNSLPAESFSTSQLPHA